MKNIRLFLSKNFHFLVVKFSVHLNRHVFVMIILHTLNTLHFVVFFSESHTVFTLSRGTYLPEHTA